MQTSYLSSWRVGSSNYFVQKLFPLYGSVSNKCFEDFFEVKCSFNVRFYVYIFYFKGLQLISTCICSSQTLTFKLTKTQACFTFVYNLQFFLWLLICHQFYITYTSEYVGIKKYYFCLINKGKVKVKTHFNGIIY